MSALGRAGLGVSAVGIWTKKLQKGVACVWGQEEAEKTKNNKYHEKKENTRQKGSRQSNPQSGAYGELPPY